MNRICIAYDRVMMAMAGVLSLAMILPGLSPARGQAPAEVKPAAATASAPAADGVWAASGGGGGKDPADWGKSAGRQAKEACQNRQPDIVLAFDFGCNFGKNPEINKGFVDGVAESFDKKLIYGGSIHGPEITNSIPHASGGVLALGGIKATPVKIKPEKDKEQEAYTALAESLKAPYAAAAGQGRLILILGECVPRDNATKVVEAFTRVLGKDVCLFGSPTPGGWQKNPSPYVQYFQGEMLQDHLLAVLITGDFTCSFAMADAAPARKGDQGQDPDKIVESAEKAMKVAVGDKKDSAALILVTNCFTRNHSLGRGKEKRPTGMQDEFKALTNGITAPLFGVMDDVEIGHPATGEPAVAQEDRINICVIARPKK